MQTVADTDEHPSATARASAHVVLERVTKKFGDLVVFRDVDLEVAPGEVVAIIGPSGAGKSTLLRCVNLLETPSSGRVVIGDTTVSADGRSTVGGRSLATLRRQVGMVFQSFNLFPHLTILRNIVLPQMRVLGRDRASAEHRARDLLERVGLGDKAETYPNRCSGGQQQRAAIARALALEPSVMLFDEPTSALDPELGAEVLGVMRELAGEGMTMLVVTHAFHFAEDVADRVVVMAEGEVIEAGTADEVFNHPRHPRTQRFLRAVDER